MKDEQLFLTTLQLLPLTSRMGRAASPKDLGGRVANTASWEDLTFPLHT